MKIIFHITNRDDWSKAKEAGTYTVPSLETEGFIHCSTATQILRTANKFYKGKQNLLLLCIDSEKIEADLKFEVSAGGAAPGPIPDSSFPHIYGPLNTDAVVDEIDFPPGADGTFQLPEKAANLHS